MPKTPEERADRARRAAASWGHPPRPDRPVPGAAPNHGPPPQYVQGPSFADKVQGVMSLISLGIILVVGIAVWNFCGNIMDAEADIPQPGSAADQMCDVNRERMNPDHVKYGDTWYDADCLLQYPWNEPLG